MTLPIEPEMMEPVEPVEPVAPTPEELAAQERAEEQKRRAIAAILGAECPLAKSGEASEADWARWPKSLWEKHEAPVAPREHVVARNRLFRDGQQWVSSTGPGPWKEPPRPRDAARIVANVIKPALDLRHQIVIEQRPGFRTKPTGHDPEAQRKAEAQQRALEYQYDQQNAEAMLSEAAYWAGTDGVSFPCLYWDADRGPWFEVPGGAEGQQEQYQGGDIAPMVYRLEQVRVSANATATQRPRYWVVREVLAKADAVARYGPEIVKENEGRGPMAGAGRSTGTDTGRAWQSSTTSGSELFADQETVERYTVYCERLDPYLPQGLLLVVVGDAVVVDPKPLPWGVVPIFRLADGTSDPSFYPKAQMEDWVSDQMMLNAALSKWVESVRRNADGRIAVLAGKVATETLVGGMTSLLELRGVNAVNEAMQVIPGFSIGNDVKELIQFAMTSFERKSGWNDATRGSFDGGESGRSILAQREVVERTFAPMVRAASQAMKEWAMITLNAMRWGYTEPRKIALTGKSRSDLAMEITSETFDGIADVTIDPETMMPMPRSLRLFLLGDMLEKQIISPTEYRRRMPFAFTGEIESPDEDHFARAKRVCQAIRETGDPNALPLLWQDNEAIHQDVLERDLILPDDTDPVVRDAAVQRWTLLAQQSAMKQGGPPQQGGEMTPGAPQQGAPSLSPDQAANAPLAMNNPSVAAAPLAMTDEGNAQAFDSMSAQ